jgi:hypothetical protein
VDRAKTDQQFDDSVLAEESIFERPRFGGDLLPPANPALLVIDSVNGSTIRTYSASATSPPRWPKHGYRYTPLVQQCCL